MERRLNMGLIVEKELKIMSGWYIIECEVWGKKEEDLSGE